MDSLKFLNDNKNIAEELNDPLEEKSLQKLLSSTMIKDQTQIHVKVSPSF